MSFDPLTAVWAANKAIEAAGSSGGGSGSASGEIPVVDLSDIVVYNGDKFQEIAVPTSRLEHLGTDFAQKAIKITADVPVSIIVTPHVLDDAAYICSGLMALGEFVLIVTVMRYDPEITGNTESAVTMARINPAS